MSDVLRINLDKEQLVQLGFKARLFSFTPLPLQELAIVVGLAVLYIVVLDVIKVWYYRRREKNASPSPDVAPVALVKH